MFSKDPVSIALAHASLKTLVALQPDIIMPSIIDRAYSGLESINEVFTTPILRFVVMNLLHRPTESPQF